MCICIILLIQNIFSTTYLVLLSVEQKWVFYVSLKLKALRISYKKTKTNYLFPEINVYLSIVFKTYYFAVVFTRLSIYRLQIETEITESNHP